MSARGASLKRRVRSFGGTLIRKLGLVPAGTPDRRGEDESVKNAAWAYEVMVYFADTTDALYQIEQWYASFQELNRVHPVVVICQDSRTAAAIKRDSGLAVYTIARSDTVDSILSATPSLRLCLYVTHNVENFANLRFGQMIHASMMHGDSDKLVTVSNQTKAYDFSLVAGQAAVDRMQRYSKFYDAQTRCITIGRPQLDVLVELLGEKLGINKNLETILYAPSWEGDDRSGAYGTVESHGLELVRSLISTGKFRVIYRPHPLTGVRLPSFGEADTQIRQLIEQEGRVSNSRVDVKGRLADAFIEADLLISDISGVAIDWLPTGKPLVLTVPADPNTRVAESKLTHRVPRLTVKDASTANVTVSSALQDEELRDDLAELTEYYLGDISAGAATKRFLAACDRMIDLNRDEESEVKNTLRDLN